MLYYLLTPALTHLVGVSTVLDIAPRLLYAVAGSLAYGGNLHHLMAGTLFAGRGVASNVRLADCNGYQMMEVRKGSELDVELYYVDASTLQHLDRELTGLLGTRRSTLVVRAGGIEVLAEAHVAAGCKPTSLPENAYVRVLLALPPSLPPPVEPLAALPAIVDGVRPCGDVFCPSPGSSWEAAVVDVYLTLSRLREWGRGRLRHLIARSIHGLRLYVLAPVGGVEG
jgi:gamma-glutamylcyclotransferase (GGCT)/AIG2-like uncharacterized protein YtfP